MFLSSFNYTMEHINQLSLRLTKKEAVPVNEQLRFISEQIQSTKTKDIILYALARACDTPMSSDEKDTIIKDLEREIEEQKQLRQSLDQQVIDQLNEINQLKLEVEQLSVANAQWADRCLLLRDSEKLEPLLQAYERRHKAGRAHSDTLENFVAYLFDVIAEAAHPDELLKPINEK